MYGEEGTRKRNDEVGENVYNAEGETQLATSHTIRLFHFSIDVTKQLDSSSTRVRYVT